MRPFIFNDIIDDDDDLPFGPSDNTHSDSNAKVDEITFDTIKVSSAPEIFKVVPTTEKAKRFCEVHVGKLNRITDSMSDIIKMDAALFESGKDFISVYKNIDCEFKIKSSSVVINDANAETLNVGISYRQPFYYEDGKDCILSVEILFATDDATFGMFDVYESASEKHNSLLKYNFLTTAQKKFFKRQYNSPAKTGKKDTAVYTPIRDAGALIVLYETSKHSYDEHIRSKAEVILSQLNSNHSYGDKADLINQLSHILGINTHHLPSPKNSFYEIMEMFDNAFYGMHEVKEKLAECICAIQHAEAGGVNILLVGPPGIGKTSICQIFSNALRKPLIHIDCAGSDNASIEGIRSLYGGAKAGKVVDCIWEVGQTDALILMDEIDKFIISRDGSPFSILIKMLGPQQQIRDEYVDTDIDSSPAIIIATANDKDSIPGFILNRFGDNIFYLDGYTVKEKTEIARQFSISSILRKNKISTDELIITDDALYLLADTYCEDHGMREMESYINTIAIKAIRFWSCNEASKPLVVDSEFIHKHIKKMKNTSANTSRKAGFL